MCKDKNGWIPVSEGLPEDGQNCFIWYDNDILFFPKSWCFTIYSRKDGFDINGVTHWRPIFKPPIKNKRK